MSESAVIEPAAAAAAVTLREALPVWTRVAAQSFGGPAGQIAVMHRVIVDEKKWIGEDRFLHALNFCMLLPGPEAQQLATYIGWLMHGWRGGLMAGGLFILPGFVCIMAMSLLYAAYGQLEVVAGIFFGLKAAVIVIVAEALVRISRRAFKRRIHYGIAAAAFVCIAVVKAPFPLIILGAAGFGAAFLKANPSAEALAAGRPRTLLRSAGILLLGLVLWWAPVIGIGLSLGRESVFFKIGMFFSKAAVVTFGGAYAVLAYVAQEASGHFGWLNHAQMMDGLAMAETTPGPLIMVLQFVGFMGARGAAAGMPPWLAGVVGGCLTVWVTFVPCFLWIFLFAPYVERLRGMKRLAGALEGVTAAVVGVILNLGVWFAFHAIYDPTRAGFVDRVNWFMLALTGVAGWLTFRMKMGMAKLLAVCAGAGLAWVLLLPHR